MRRKKRKIRDAFHAAGALTPADSCPLQDLGLEETMALRRLQRRDVVRESAPGLFYFDEEVWQVLRATRLRMAILIVVALVLFILVGLYGASQKL